MNIKKKIIFPIVTIGLSLVVALIAAEFILQIVGLFSISVSQEKPLDYKDAWLPDEQMGPGGFLQPDFDAWVLGGYGNKVKWVNNSDGFRNETDFEQTPPDSTLRIMSLGDSFTAGYRVGQHDTFSWVLQQNLNQLDLPKDVQVMVSCIEDPGYALYYLQQYGYQFKPDVVLLGITLANDITETYVRVDEQGTFDVKPCGDYHCLIKKENHTTVEYWNNIATRHLPDEAIEGPIQHRERFAKKSILDYSALYKLSKEYFQSNNIVNQPYAIISGVNTEYAPLFDMSSGLGFFLKDYPPIIEECWDRLFLVLRDMNAFCNTNGMRLVIGLHPQRFQVQPPDWQKTIEYYQLRESQFDLNKPNQILLDFCTKNGIPLIDPTNFLLEYYTNNNESLHFPLGDMHWNEIGHEIYGDFLTASHEKYINIDQ